MSRRLAVALLFLSALAVAPTAAADGPMPFAQQGGIGPSAAALGAVARAERKSRATARRRDIRSSFDDGCLQYGVSPSRGPSISLLSRSSS